MNEKEVIKMLSHDASCLILPPISEKVRQAVHEQRRRNLEIISDGVTVKHSHKISTAKYIFAAALVLLAVSIPMIVVLTKHIPRTNISENSVVSDGSQTVSQAASTIADTNALERIQMQQVYGTVFLSCKSEEELKTLLVTYTKENRVYEDERYLYHFDAQGHLLEMRNLMPLEDSGSSVATERDIKQKAMDCLQVYFPGYDLSDDKMSLSENEDSYPHWHVVFAKAANDNVETQIRMDFNESGDLRSIVTSGTEVIASTISKAEAIELALQEIRSGKYDIPVFSNEEVTITAEVKNREDKTYYFVLVNNIPLDELTTAGIYVEISADTGNIVSVKF